MEDDQRPRKWPVKELVHMRQQVGAYNASTGGNGASGHHDNDGRLERLQAIIRAVTDGTYEWDLTSSRLELDGRLRTLVGAPIDGDSHGIAEFLNLIHPDDVGAVNAALDAHLRLNQPYTAEFRIQLLGGDYRWASVVGEPVLDAHGNTISLMCALTLIDGDKAAASDMMESESRLRSLFEGISDGLALLTSAGQVLDANAQACEFLGYDLADLVESGLLGIIVPNQVVAGIGLLGRTAGTGKASGRVGILHGDGTVILAEMDMVKLPDSTIMCSIRDSSSTVGASDREVQEKVMESLSRLSRDLAHELNNALTPVMGYAQLSERALPEDSEVRNYLHSINNAADRAAGISSQLLAFAQRQVGNPEDVNPSQVVADIGDGLRAALGDNIELTLHIDDDVWPARLDPNRIQHALLSMAENSREAMPFGGDFIVEVANAYLDSDYARTRPGVSSGDYVCVTVTDTGVGMTEDVRAHIFEPLFTTKEPGEGLGMGLSTAYGNVKQAGGHIEVSSRPREGTTFRMYFPRAHEGDES